MENFVPGSYYRAGRATECMLTHGTGNQNVPLFAQGTFGERLPIACTKLVTVELMDISGL